MPTYVDLLKLLEEAPARRAQLVLPHPLEEIFPEKLRMETQPEPHVPWVERPSVNEHQELLKKTYEDLVTATFQGRA